VVAGSVGLYKQKQYYRILELEYTWKQYPTSSFYSEGNQTLEPNSSAQSLTTSYIDEDKIEDAMTRLRQN
jgi:hypothetical protein